LPCKGFIFFKKRFRAYFGIETVQALGSTVLVSFNPQIPRLGKNLFLVSINLSKRHTDLLLMAHHERLPLPIESAQREGFLCPGENF